MRPLAAASLLTVVALAYPTRSAEATSIVLFSNLGAPNAYDCCTGWTVSGSASSIGTDIDVGSPFVPPVTSTLASIDAALGFSSGTNAMDLWLMSDVGGFPDAILESFHFTGLPVFGSTGNALTIATSALHPLLLAGTQSWVIASVSGDTIGTFNLNITGDLGFASRFDGGSWSATADQLPAAAFRVSGTSTSEVPEPASVVLLGSVLAVVARALGRQRRR